MKKLVCFAFALLFASFSAYAQDDHEFITIFDFENEQPPQINADWGHFFDFTIEGEPIHNGETSLILDIGDTTAPWRFSTWNFPDDIGTVDLSETDQMEVWVYTEDGPFQMNWEFGGLNLGYRFYTEEDQGTWKRLSYWYTEENAQAFTEISSWGSFINPAAFNGFPEGFTGAIFMDDIAARVRKPTPDREFLMLNGLNSVDDLANVTVAEGAQGDGIIIGGEVPAQEGGGYLSFLLSDANNDRFTFDLSNVSELPQYDRIHFDVYMDGVASGFWGNFQLFLDTTQIDENGEIVLDDEGNPEIQSTNILGGSYVTVAQEEWHSFSAQYGPVEETDGFTLQDFKESTLIPAFNTEGASVALRMSTNGGGVEGVPMYIDNIRLSRPLGTPVENWDLY